MLTDELAGMSREEVLRLPKEFVLELLGIDISATRMKCAMLGLKIVKSASLCQPAEWEDEGEAGDPPQTQRARAELWLETAREGSKAEDLFRGGRLASGPHRRIGLDRGEPGPSGVFHPRDGAPSGDVLGAEDDLASRALRRVHRGVGGRGGEVDEPV